MSQSYYENPKTAAAYSKIRPKPPVSLIKSILDYLRSGYDGPLEAALDVGCGPGQSTYILAPHFTSVTGIDISEAQIAEAVKLNKTPAVSFRVSRAELLPFPDSSQQLVTAGQACHWFDVPKFLKEADRVLVPGGVVALYCYDWDRVVHPHLAEKLSALIDEVYKDQLATGCWGKGVTDVGHKYQDPKYTIPYPDSCRDETHVLHWEGSVADVILCLTSWAGFNAYREKNGEAAAQKVLNDFQEKFVSTLGVKTPPEKTPVQLYCKTALLMGRKPSA